MNKRLKDIPKFENELQEEEFWSEHDSTDYIDWSAADDVEFPDLKPSTKTISIRLPEFIINDYKRLANKMDIPYQSLMKAKLSEGIKNEGRP